LFIAFALFFSYLENFLVYIIGQPHGVLVHHDELNFFFLIDFCYDDGIILVKEELLQLSLLSFN